MAVTKEKREQITKLLEEHVPWRTIKQLAKCGEGTIMSIRDEMVRNGFDEDKEISIKLSRVSVLALGKLEEAIESGEVKAKDLSVVAGVSLDKRLLLSGRATSRVEHVRSDTAALREQLADVIDVSTCQTTPEIPENRRKSVETASL
jgi:hypothetical protein